MKKMLNRIKYSFLCLIITSIVACEEIPEEPKVAPIKAPLIITEYLEDSTLNNLEATDEPLALLAAYNLQKIWHRQDEMDTLVFSEFQDYYEFTWVKEISAKQKVVVLGIEYEEDAFELFLLNKIEDSIWELKAFERIDTRFVIEPSDVQYDSMNKLLHFVVEQTWSSDGDLAFELFYQIKPDTLLQVLQRNNSGGQELDVAAHRQDNCNMELIVNFNSDLEKVSKNELQFLYQYEILLYSTCDGTTEIRDTILKESDRIMYTYNPKNFLYVPNWNSLEKLNQAQFEAITGWGDLDPFKLEIENYCQKTEKSKPKSAKLLRAAFF